MSVDLDVLLARKQYEELLKITENKNDFISLVFYFYALLGLKKDKEAITHLNKNIKIIEENDLVVAISLQLEYYRNKNDYASIYAMHEKYKDYPYHSQVVEELTRELPIIAKEIAEGLINEKKIKKNQEKEIIEALKRLDTSPDFLVGLYSLDVKAIKKYTPYLKEYLVSEKVSKSIKNQILLRLFDADKNLEVKYLDKDKIINLSAKVNYFFINSKEFSTLLKDIQNYSHNVTYAEDASLFAFHYFLSIYPYENFDKKKANQYKAAFIYLASQFFNAKDEEDEIASYYKVKKEDMVTLSDEIMKVLNKVLIERNVGE